MSVPFYAAFIPFLWLLSTALKLINSTACRGPILPDTRDRPILKDPLCVYALNSPYHGQNPQ